MCMHFFGRAMSLANPNQPLPFQTTLTSPFLKKVYASTDDDVIKYRKKYEISFAISVLIMIAIAVCVSNAPRLEITH